MKTILRIIQTLVLIIFLASCKEETSYSYINLNMTDAPAAYTAVNIDLKQVELTGEHGTVIMDTKPGIYNLLDLTNGKNVLIATSSIKSGRLEQIRLILGDNNTITANGITYPLVTPSAQESGLKVQVHKELEDKVVYNFVLDFDANASIVEQGNGSFLLKPVLRLIDQTTGGSITGSVTPPGQVVSVTVTGNDLTFTTNTSTEGSFFITGIPEGVYTVIFYPPSPLVTVTLTNINVTKGATTDMGVVNLAGQ